MSFELPVNYSGEDIHVDYTDKLKKVWDNVIPKTFANVLEFDTKSAIWVEHKKTIGPYHIWEDKMYAKINLVLSDKPFYENGWDGEATLTQEDFNKVYTKEFFLNLRDRMYQLSKYLGLKLDNFTLIDNFSILVKDEPNTSETTSDN